MRTCSASTLTLSLPPIPNAGRLLGLFRMGVSRHYGRYGLSPCWRGELSSCQMDGLAGPTLCNRSAQQPPGLALRVMLYPMRACLPTCLPAGEHRRANRGTAQVLGLTASRCGEVVRASMHLGCCWCHASPAQPPFLCTPSIPPFLPPSIHPRRVLPLDGICAATLGALRAMMLDQQGAADVAALAASIQSSPSLRPDAPCAVSLGAAGSGRVAVKPSPPRPSFITVQRSCDGPGQGGSNGWTMDGSSAAVELSGPSSLPTPSTARPTSPDVPDVFAGGLL